MTTVKVRICTGTLCYVMGGSELQLLGECLPEELQEKVEISGATCLDYCNQEGHGKAPFVLVNDRLICGATIAKVIDAIHEELSIK